MVLVLYGFVPTLQVGWRGGGEGGGEGEGVDWLTSRSLMTTSRSTTSAGCTVRGPTEPAVPVPPAYSAQLCMVAYLSDLVSYGG